MELVEVLKTLLVKRNIEISEIASNCFVRIEDVIVRALTYKTLTLVGERFDSCFE